MCSSSLSSCCTSWTWCSFQPCPVGNRAAFLSLRSCVCVCVLFIYFFWWAVSRASSDTNSRSCKTSSMDWPPRFARMNAAPIHQQNATNATPFSMCVLCCTVLPRRGHFLHFLLYLSISPLFLSLFLLKVKQSQCQPECSVMGATPAATPFSISEESLLPSAASYFSPSFSSFSFPHICWQRCPTEQDIL